MRALVFTVGALLLGGCRNACEEASDKIDSCRQEIHGVDPILGGAIGDDCSGESRCLAECVNDASCEELARISTSSTDPNEQIPPGVQELLNCLRRCRPQ